MQSPEAFVVATRFRGPTHSANGGYCCGRLALLVGEPSEVTLKRPPPLETRLEFARGELRQGMRVLATARQSELDLEVPSPISFDEARARERYYPGFKAHPYPECFVCGPARPPGDGLCIFPGRVEPDQPVAASFIPDESLADELGYVRREFVWSALDCPGYFAAATHPVRALLGRMTGATERPIQVGQRCVVMAWSLGQEGRKLHAGSALFTEHGELVARSRQTWLEVA